MTDASSTTSTELKDLALWAKVAVAITLTLLLLAIVLAAVTNYRRSRKPLQNGKRLKDIESLDTNKSKMSGIECAGEAVDIEKQGSLFARLWRVRANETERHRTSVEPKGTEHDIHKKNFGNMGSNMAIRVKTLPPVYIPLPPAYLRFEEPAVGERSPGSATATRRDLAILRNAMPGWERIAR